MRLTVDGRLGPEEIARPAARARTCQRSFRFNSRRPGDHLVEVSIDDDPLALDNRRFMVVPVREVAQGSAGRRPFQVRALPGRDRLSGAGACPERGIAGAAAADPGRGRRRDRSFPTASFRTTTWWSCATSPSSISPRRRPWTTFSSRGAGSSSSAAIRSWPTTTIGCSTPTARDSAGGDRPERGRRRQERRGLLLQSAGLPASASISEYQGETDPVTAGMTQAITLAISQAGAAQGDARPRSRWRSTTAIRRWSRCTRHRGTVILVATSADTGWTTWPVHKSYLPIMQQIVMRASAGRFAERNIRVGQPFDQSFPAAGRRCGGHGRRRPRGSRSRPSCNPPGGVSQFHFEQTDLAGQYQVKIGPPLSRRVVVRRQPRPGRERSDQARSRGLAEQIPGWNFLYLTNSQRAGRGRELGRASGRAASAVALRAAGHAAAGIVPGVEIRAS